MAFVDGIPSVTSIGPRSEVSLTMEAERFDEKRPIRLLVRIKNNSGETLNITGANITASTDLALARVLTAADYEALERKAVRKQINAAKWAAFGAALSAASAGMQQSGYYNQTTTYGYGRATTYGTYTPPRDTTAQQLIAQRQMEQASATIQEGRATIDDRAVAARSLGFTPVTLADGDIYVNPIPIDGVTRKAKTINVVIEIAGDHHPFSLTTALVR